jgi:hypothetical protein
MKDSKVVGQVSRDPEIDRLQAAAVVRTDEGGA